MTRRINSATIYSLLCLFALFVAALVVIPANAEMFKWVDEHGTIHYGDKPPAEQPTLEIKGKITSYDSPSIESLPTDLEKFITRKSKQKVIMYSAEWCGVCKTAKKYFFKKRIAFDERDIEKSAHARKEFNKLGGRGIPVILVGKQRMNGFSKSRFEKMYNKKT